MIKNTFLEDIENINNAMVRNEFKLWIYKNYLLPSKRFMLTIHVLTDTHLKLLDTLTDKAIKKWSGLPPSATNALIHMQEGLHVKSISEFYAEAHTVSHTRTRLKGDKIVNSVVDATIARESQYTRKGSTCIESEARYQAAVDSCSVGGEIPTNCEKFNAEVDKSVKTALCVENRDHWETHVKSLVVQGQYLALAAAEKQDVV